MTKNIREIIKKLPKKTQKAIEARAKVLIKEEMIRLTLSAQEELSKLGLTIDQLKSAVSKRTNNRLKSRYLKVFNDEK